MSNPITALKQAVGALVKIELEAKAWHMRNFYVGHSEGLQEINRKLALRRKRYREAIARVETAIRMANLP